MPDPMTAGPKSRALFRLAEGVLVGGVNSPVRAFRAVGGAPLFMQRAKGSRIQDADGRWYLDLCLSWGPLILGHAHPQVLQAVRKALKDGTTFGASTEREIRLAQVVSEAIPSMELVRFTSSGTEAVMSAVRLARAYTRRQKVVKFAGCYHGHVDSLLVQAGSGAATLGTPDSEGVPASWAQDTICLPYNDVEAVQAAFHRWGGEIACVIVEPVAANMGVVVPRPGYLQFLREITFRHRAFLIFDEVVTGFRLGYGGAQTLFGIQPDLTCLGKIIGGGFPVGAFGGRREIMGRVAPLGPVYQSGTLSGNPVAMAAGLETLDFLKKRDPYPHLARLTTWLTNGIRERGLRRGVPVQVNHTASMFTVFFSERAVTDWESAKSADVERFKIFFHELLPQGVYFPPAQWEAAFVSLAHSPSDIEELLEAIGQALTSVAGRKPPKAKAPSRSKTAPPRRVPASP